MKYIFNKTIGGSYERKLPVMNMKRCTIAAVLLALFIPTILITNIVFLNQTLIRPEYNKYLGSILLISVVFLFVRVLVGSKYEYRRFYGIIYRSFLIICSGFMILLCNSYFRIEGSLFYYFLTMLFFAIIPVFNVGELLFSEAIVIAFMVYLIGTNKAVVSVVSQILIFNFARIIVTVWKYAIVARGFRAKMAVENSPEYVTRDLVTDFLNTAGLNRRMEIMWDVCRRNKVSCGAMTMDISYLVSEYEIYGFESADECIKDIADNVRKTLRDKTDIFARTGKYRFTIVACDKNQTELLLMAKKLQYNLECGKYTNIGIVLLKDTRKDTYANILKVANNSLRVAKQSDAGAIAYGRKLVR